MSGTAKLSFVDYFPLFVAGISLVGTGANTAYNFSHDATREPCTLARDWLIAGKPNPSISAVDAAELSRRLVTKIKECAR